MNSHVEKYYVEGFALVIAPGQVLDAVIYFRSMGHSPNIVGIECYDKAKGYVGYVYPQNLTLEIGRAARLYVKSHPKKWTRVHLSVGRDDVERRK